VKIIPKFDYVLGKEIQVDTGVVSTGNISDTKQYYEVLAVGEGRHQSGVFVPTQTKVGDTVIIMKQAAEGDTPPELYGRGYALFMESRIMAVSKEDK
jgi:co-chaperonin GroES (HSP10)